jgi:hypothetical protein
MGVVEAGARRGYDAGQALDGIREMSLDPDASLERLNVLLGWTQAIVAMSCGPVTMADVTDL